MVYPIMETPFELVNFECMKKKQVEQYFQWFMLEKENRLSLLEKYIDYKSEKKVVLDKTPESLIDLWEWFEGEIEWEEKSKEELREELRGRPEWMHEIIMSNTKEETLLTKAIACDIATYFAETILHNNASIRWGYLTRPKKLDGVNRPILVGFKYNMSMNPITLIGVAVSKSLKSRDTHRLYGIYNVWLEYIE